MNILNFIQQFSDETLVSLAFFTLRKNGEKRLSVKTRRAC